MQCDLQLTYLQDYLRERRIRRLAREIENYSDVCSYSAQAARECWEEMVREINARSTRQVERMERARGLRT